MSISCLHSATRTAYRDLYHIIRQQPKPAPLLTQLREGFRRPLEESETVEDRLREAESKLGFLRISSSRRIVRRQEDGGRWVYRNGERLRADGTVRDSKGRVVSNWDGSNLDPDSVRHHNKQLRRAGFVNNLHAKGMF